MTTKETVLQRLIDLNLVIDRNDGERWMLDGKIPAFGYRTATQLIIEDKADALLDEIERMASGGYA